MTKLSDAQSKAALIKQETERAANTHQRLGEAIEVLTDAVEASSSISSVPPVDAHNGAKWVSAISGKEFTKYNGQWVEF